MASVYVLPIGAWIGIILVVCLVVVFVVVVMTSNNVTPVPPPPPFNPVDVTTSTPDGTYEPTEVVPGTTGLTVNSVSSINRVTLQQDPNDPYTLKSNSVNTVTISPAEGAFEPGNSYTISPHLHIANQTSPDYNQSGSTSGGNNFLTTTNYNSSQPVVSSAEVRGGLPTNIRSIMFSRAEGETTLFSVTYIVDLPHAILEEIQISGIAFNFGTTVEPIIRAPETVEEYLQKLEELNTAGYVSQLTVNITYVANNTPCTH